MKEFQEKNGVELKSITDKDDRGNAIGTRYFIGETPVVFIGARRRSEKTEWDKPENIKGDFKPLSGLAGAEVAPWNGKLLGGQAVAGFFIRTPEEQQIWRAL